MMTFDPKFTISEDILNKCTVFAKNSVNTSIDKYARRNQFDIETIMRQIQIGKIGEEGVYEKTSVLYPALSKPDHQIYDKKDKSWSSDLIDSPSGIHIAVKTQDIGSAISFGESWVFQYGNGGKYDCDTGVFKTVDPKHYVAFVGVNVPKRVGTLRAIVKIQWLHDKKLFKEMKKKDLRGNKVAVYYEDLEKFKDELWQL
jgi:hypothetical protein